MKKLGITLIVLLVLALAGTGWLLINCNVTVSAGTAAVTEASAQAELFATVKQQQADKAFVGTVFSSAPLGEAADYQFVTYTIHMKNTTFLTADMVEVQVTSMDGDVLQFGDETARALPAGQEGSLQVTTLSRIGMHTARELIVTYYLWGVPFTLKTTAR